ncbi:MAG: hypothetical protein M1600_15000 [Firmicutes bacterium]|nr:hypothetical protein [Bacillota bacterium]
MSVPADEVYQVIEQLSSCDRKTVYDLAQFLLARHQTAGKAWSDIETQEPDFEPLSPEQADQLRDPKFVSWIQTGTMAYEVRIRRSALNYLNKLEVNPSASRGCHRGACGSSACGRHSPTGRAGRCVSVAG